MRCILAGSVVALDDFEVFDRMANGLWLFLYIILVFVCDKFYLRFVGTRLCVGVSNYYIGIFELSLFGSGRLAITEA